MPILIPAPAELDLSPYAEGDEFELPVTFTLTGDGQLYATAVAGAPIELDEAGTGGEDEEGGEMSFADAVEAGMQ